MLITMLLVSVKVKLSCYSDKLCGNLGSHGDSNSISQEVNTL